MAKQRVSSDFAKWRSKTANKLADAKKAENNMAGIPFPVGTTGLCTVIDVQFGTTKKNAHPYMTMKCIADSGQKFSKMYLFNDTANATGADRWSWMLNEFENSGMPRSFREEKGDDENELLAYFLDGEQPIKMAFEVEADSYQQGGKRVSFRSPEGMSAVQAQDSIVCASSPEEIKVDGYVLWNDVPQRVISINEDKVVVKSTTTNNQRTMLISDLTF
jgi:hypothetical protein